VHERFTALMSLQLDGMTSPVEQLELRQHLAECPECAAMWEQWQVFHLLLSTTPSAAPSRNLVVDLSQKADTEAPRWCRPGCLLLAALLLGALGLVRTCFASASLLWLACLHLSKMAQAPLAGALRGLCCSPANAAIPSMIAFALALTFLAVICAIVAAGLVGLIPCLGGSARNGKTSSK
jgi:predicted anti-sigma-YlaC factor YlaD